jgi:hypothetical protein
MPPALPGAPGSNTAGAQASTGSITTTKDLNQQVAGMCKSCTIKQAALQCHVPG